MVTLIQFLHHLGNNGYKFKVEKPVKLKMKNIAKIKLEDDGYIEYSINKNILVKGGRKEGLKVLKKVKNQENYNEDRNNINSFNYKIICVYKIWMCIN